MSGTTANGFTGEAYQPQEDVYFDDGREIALLHFIYSHPNLAAMRGNPSAVLAAIDEYGRTQRYLMNIGAYKARTVVDAIRAARPRVMVELGGYVGYSAIAFGAALRDAGGERYYTLEKSPEFGAVISSLVDLAGLRDVVMVEIGESGESIRRLFPAGLPEGMTTIDLLFLDHIKPAYTPDLKLCEELGLIKPGSVLVADNVVKPGNPPYLEYVRSEVSTKRAKAWSHTPSDGPRGNPGLVYESKFVEGWEPSGVPDALEITKCVGETEEP